MTTMMVMMAMMAMMMTTTAAAADNNVATQYCAERGIMSAERPNDIATRAEVATAIYRAAGYPVEENFYWRICFNDIEDHEWFAEPFRFLVATTTAVMTYESYYGQIIARPYDWATCTWTMVNMERIFAGFSTYDRYGYITRGELASMIYEASITGVGVQLDDWHQTRTGILPKYMGSDLVTQQFAPPINIVPMVG